MSYQLLESEPIPDGMRRIVVEQIDDAVSKLTDPVYNLNKSVHESRKSIKRIRAVLRLVRGEMGRKIYGRENEDYRDTARLISDVRDSYVVPRTLQKFITQHDRLHMSNYTFIHRALMEAHYEATRAAFVEHHAPAHIAQHLLRARERVREWPLHTDDFDAFEPGLRRVYERGQNEMGAALINATPDHYHDWRKRVKYLWYHAQILKKRYPTLGALENPLDQLADLLGDAHDYVALTDHLSEYIEHAVDQQTIYDLIDLLDEHRQMLEAEAIAKGGQIYNEPGDLFIERVQA